jgi:hypothetical protein
MLTCKQFVGVFSLCFLSCKGYKKRTTCRFLVRKRRKFSLSRHFIFLYQQDMS